MALLICEIYSLLLLGVDCPQSPGGSHASFKQSSGHQDPNLQSYTLVFLHVHCKGRSVISGAKCILWTLLWPSWKVITAAPRSVPSNLPRLPLPIGGIRFFRPKEAAGTGGGQPSSKKMGEKACLYWYLVVLGRRASFLAQRDSVYS